MAKAAFFTHQNETILGEQVFRSLTIEISRVFRKKAGRIAGRDILASTRRPYPMWQGGRQGTCLLCGARNSESMLEGEADFAGRVFDLSWVRQQWRERRVCYCGLGRTKREIGRQV
jgi:hypothetical protein